MEYIIGHQKPDLDTVASAVSAQFLFEHASCFGYKKAVAVTAESCNEETRFVFDRFGIQLPHVLGGESLTNDDLFILVDHNEASQRHESIRNEAIVEIIDHHTINLQSHAMYVTVKPWGSTASIIYFLMKQNGVTPSEGIAGIMLSSILSDTVGFRSSTTTPTDQEYAHELATYAKVTNIEAFAHELFLIRSNTKNLTNEEIVTKDYKIFTMGKKQVLINQVETADQSTFIEQKNALVKSMNTVRNKQGIDYIFCAITDVLKINTVMIYTNKFEKAILDHAFNPAQIEENIVDIGARISRKKDFVPQIQKSIEDGENS